MKFTSLVSSKNLFASFLLAIAALPAAHAQTYQTTVNGTLYDFSTITGSYADNQALLSSQPWFGSLSNSVAFATEVWDNLGGTVNSDEEGPYFAWASSGSTVSYSFYYFDEIYSFSNLSTSTSRVFAVATAVPVPEIDGTLLPQALALMGASVLFIRRRKS